MLLVVGGAGYIGSHMVKLLCDMGEEVVVLDNFSTGKRALVDERACIIVGDCGDRTILNTIFDSFTIEAVFHFASYIYVEEGEKFPLKYFENNVSNTVTLLSIMKQHQIGKIVFSSTAAAYGIPEALASINELSPLNPINTYGQTKITAELIIQNCANAWNLNYSILRYFNAAGAAAFGDIGEWHDPEPHLIPTILNNILYAKSCNAIPEVRIYGTDYDTKDGTCIRDFIHVDDLVMAHYMCLNSMRAGRRNLLFNVGSGKGYSIRDVIKEVCTATKTAVEGVPRERRAGDPLYLVADVSKIEKELGWTPTYSLQDIISTAWRWEQNKRLRRLKR